MQKKKERKQAYVKKSDRAEFLNDCTTNTQLLEVWPELATDYASPASQRTVVWRVEKSALRKMREILAEAGISAEDINYGQD
jgi:hypothetical protein